MKFLKIKFNPMDLTSRSFLESPGSEPVLPPGPHLSVFCWLVYVFCPEVVFKISIRETESNVLTPSCPNQKQKRSFKCQRAWQVSEQRRQENTRERAQTGEGVTAVAREP